MSELINKYNSLELSDKKLIKNKYNQDEKIEILDTIEKSSFVNLDLELKSSKKEKLEILNKNGNKKEKEDNDNPYKLDLLNTKLYNRDFKNKNSFFIGSCFAFLYYRGYPLITLGPHCNK
jgi:hypothetical protein